MYLLSSFYVSSDSISDLRYADVYWRTQKPVDLDPAVVETFMDRTMAIVGYEANLVIVPSLLLLLLT